MMDRLGGKIRRSEGNASPNASHGESPELFFCASSCRINEQVNGRFQKYTLLITKKLSIDLLFLRGKYHYRDLYVGCGSLSFEGYQEFGSGIYVKL